MLKAHFLSIQFILLMWKSFPVFADNPTTLTGDYPRGDHLSKALKGHSAHPYMTSGCSHHTQCWFTTRSPVHYDFMRLWWKLRCQSAGSILVNLESMQRPALGAYYCMKHSALVSHCTELGREDDWPNATSVQTDHKHPHLHLSFQSIFFFYKNHKTTWT